MSFLGGFNFPGINIPGVTGNVPGTGSSTGSSSIWSSLFPTLVGAGSTLAAALLGSNAAGNAAATQAQAATQAAALQYQLGQQALGLQGQMFNTQQANQAPWLQAGSGGMQQLAYLLGVNPNQQIGSASPTALNGAPAGIPVNPSNPGPPPGTGPGAGPEPPLANPITNPGNTNPPRVDVGGDVDLGQLLGWFSNPYGVPGPQMNPDSTGGGGINFAGGTTLNPAGGGTAGTAGTGGTTNPAAPQWSPNLALGGFGSLSQPYGQTWKPETWDKTFQGPTWDKTFSGPTWNEQFKAPTAEEVRNTPGYQFQFEQGQHALEASAAARGNVLSGGTAKALERYGEDYADTKYGEAYNRAQGEYQQRFGEYNTNYAHQAGEYGQAYNQNLNQYQQQAGQYQQNYQQFLNTQNTNQSAYNTNYNQWAQHNNTVYNQLAALSGAGQTSAGQLNAAAGANATNAGNLLTNIGQTQATGLNNAAAANASGIVGGANAWGGALSQLGQMPMQYLLLQLLMNQGGGNVCWIAEELWGKHDPRTLLLRHYLNTQVRHDAENGWIVRLYERYGPAMARLVRRSASVRERMTALFDVGLQHAQAWQAERLAA